MAGEHSKLCFHDDHTDIRIMSLHILTKNMEQRLYPTICGLWCDNCEHFEKDCQGCSEMGGCVFWTEYADTDSCPVWTCCVEEKKLPHCGYCDEMPCERYTRFHDPDMSDEETRISLQKQKAELITRRNESTGTK